VRHDGADLRPPARAPLATPDAPGVDRSGACRQARGRVANDPPRRRQAALARLPDRGGELPPLLLDDAEAVAVAVGLRTAASGTIAGIEETSVRALAKLEQVLPSRLRRRVSALGGATSAFAFEGPRIDADLLATLAGACRDCVRLRFGYVARDERASQRCVEPSALVHSGTRWYLVAFDIDRDDWRTFRIDRIRGRARPGERARRRTVPGGDPAAFVRQRLQVLPDADRLGEPGRIRIALPAAHLREQVGGRWVTIEPAGEDACVVSTRGPWSRMFVMHLATLEAPMQVLGPPELVEAARALGAQLWASVEPG